MDYEGIKLNEFNWKKWLKIGVSVLVGIFILRALIFTIFMGEAISFVKDFNREFVTGQQAIHNKIEADQRDFDRRAADFDQVHDRIGKDFQELHNEFQKQSVHGSQLAQQVLEAKKEYEVKLIECKADSECQKYLSN